MEERATYYVKGLLRQGNAQLAREYLGFNDPEGVHVGYIIQDTPLWNDVRIPMASLRPNPVSAPVTDTFVGGSTRAWRWQSAGPNPRRLDFELQIPHGLNESPIYGVRLHIHWACGLASPAAGVGWYVDATVGNIGATFGAPITYGPATRVPTGPFAHMVSGVHTFTGLTESAVIVGNIYRDIADAYAGDDVFGLSLDAHYVVQQSGSPEEIP
jgi:hypothetical protein